MHLRPNPVLRELEASLRTRTGAAARSDITETRSRSADGDLLIDVRGDKEAVLEHAANLLLTQNWYLFEERTTHDLRYAVHLVRQKDEKATNDAAPTAEALAAVPNMPLAA